MKKYMWTNKLEKFDLLKEDNRVNAFIPETRALTEKNLRELLTKHGTVILKPAGGSGGRGIITISSEKNDSFVVQIKLNKEIVSKDDLYPHITRQILQDFVKLIDHEEINKILSDTYIVQYRIPLSEVDHRPFDIRVMVQRKPDSSWTVTGKLVKLASSGFVITNVNLGATILPLDSVLQNSTIKNLSLHFLSSQLDHVCLLAAEILGQKTPDLRVIGFDMCFDSQGKPWFIEANFDPHDYIFLHLEDKTMYETIQKFK